MTDINTVVISGTLGKAFPRSVKSGDGETLEVVNFSIMSVEETRGKERKTVVRCVGWGEDLVRNVKLLAEGDSILVQGRLSSGKDKDGNWVTEVTVSRIHMLGESAKPALPF